MMPGDGRVLRMEPLGLEIEFVRTGEETRGEVREIVVDGRPRGFLAQRHVHPAQVERLEVVSGALKVEMAGREHVLGPGQSIEVPAGTPHRQLPHGAGAGRVRIEVRPALRTQAFLERVAEMCAEGQIGRSGFPRPAAGAELVLDHAQAGHAATPSLAVQRQARRAGDGGGAAGAGLPVRRRVGRGGPSGGRLPCDRRLEDVPAVVAPGVPGGRLRRPARAGKHRSTPLQGTAALPPAHALDDRRDRPAAHRGGRGRR